MELVYPVARKKIRLLSYQRTCPGTNKEFNTFHANDFDLFTGGDDIAVLTASCPGFTVNVYGA